MQTFELYLHDRCVRESFPLAGAAPRSAEVRAHLSQLTGKLELARATVVASVAALRHQNCELDEDIANLLQRQVADVIGAELEATAQWLSALRVESGYD
ncbi:MAG: hypothetical protein ACRETB_01390 [Steroidobacteraceae bacterium]